MNAPLPYRGCPSGKWLVRTAARRYPVRRNRSRVCTYLALMLLAGSLTGCAGGPSPAPPQVKSPTRWEYAGKATAVWPKANWWHAFDSRQLDSLVKEAMAQNHDLGAAVARVRESEAGARIAGAPLYPNVGANGSIGRERDPLGRVGSSPATVTDLQLKASYEVDFWGKNRAAANAAGARVIASRYDAETVALTLVSDVASTYFEVLALRERVHLARQSLANAMNVLRVLEARRRMGTNSDQRVAQQRSAVATQRATIADLVEQEQQAVNALAVLLGRPPEALQVQGKSLQAVQLPPVVAGLPSGLLKRRPDLRKAEADLKAAKLDVVAAHAARFPSITLTAAGGVASLALDSVLSPASLLFNLAASATAPLFEGGKLAGEEDLARARAQELTQSYAQTVLGAFRDVEDALSAVHQTQIRYNYSQQAYTSARKAYHVAELRHRAGLVDYLTVFEAQRTMFEAEDAMVVTNLARYDASIALYQALGGGWGEQPAKFAREDSP